MSARLDNGGAGFWNFVLWAIQQIGRQEKQLKQKRDSRYYDRNRVRLKEKRDANIDSIRQVKRQRRLARRDQENRRQAHWRATNPQKLELYRQSKNEQSRRRWKSDHEFKTAKLASTKSWTERNKEKVADYHREYQRERLKTVRGNLDNRISHAMRLALGDAKAGRHWECLVGYSVEELMLHIQSKFQVGMNWERFISGHIHIDHVIPKSKFTYTSAEDPQFRQCWALENLQPKWALDNLSKGNKLEGHTQIPLGI